MSYAVIWTSAVLCANLKMHKLKQFFANQPRRTFTLTRRRIGPVKTGPEKIGPEGNRSKE